VLVADKEVDEISAEHMNSYSVPPRAGGVHANSPGRSQPTLFRDNVRLSVMMLLTKDEGAFRSVRIRAKAQASLSAGCLSAAYGEERVWQRAPAVWLQREGDWPQPAVTAGTRS
jgi:hypothetical protein